MSTTKEIAKGLEGIEVDETAISLVDGTRGTLSYRGYPLDTLVSWPFTRVALLVLDDEEPDEAALQAFEDELTEHAALRRTEVALLDCLAPTATHPMQVLITLATTLEHDPRAFTRYGEAARGLSIAARMPAALAYLLAKRRGSSLPETQISTRSPVLRYLHAIGAPSNPALARAMEITQILQIEHGFNAGTFAARVVASTLAPIENSIAGALAALHGILHGGADQAALETAQTVGSPAAAAAFVDD